MATWQWRHTNDLVPRYGAIHGIIRHVDKRTKRVQGNQTTQDLAGNDGRVILTEKTNQHLLQCGRIIGMREETSLLAGVLEIRVKCGCHPLNVRDLTGLVLKTSISIFQKIYSMICMLYLNKPEKLVKCKYIEKRVYRILKVAYWLGSRNISKVKESKCAFPFQLNKSHKKKQINENKEFYKIYTHKTKIRQTRVPRHVLYSRHTCGRW